MTTAKYRLNRRAFGSSVASTLLVACAGHPKVGNDADVIVIGAGLSGLNAALTLKEQGMRVSVLEADSRIGGRIQTLRDLPGRPEAGGTTIGQSYVRLQRRSKELGVGLNYSPQPNLGRAYFYGGKHITPADWSTSSHNPFPDPYRQSTPDVALFRAAAEDNPLKDSLEWIDAGEFDIDADRFLKSKGFDQRSRDLINIALNANDLKSYSMINLWRTLVLISDKRFAGPSGVIEGGSDTITTAMAAALEPGSVKLQTPVTAIHASRTGVQVYGNNTSYKADFCILAVPFPALRKISITPSLPALQQQAVNELPYTQIVRLYLEAETPFWEDDGLPPAMWTNGPFERFFAVNNPGSSDIAYIQPWINGNHARVIANLSDNEIEEMVRRELKRLRPASEGKVRLVRAVRWTEDHSSVGGAYMHWAPGQVSDWPDVMGTAVGRVHFAGEHLSRRHTGIEGALESGENTAREIIEQLA